MNNNNKKEQDAFSEAVRSKLENHRMPVDADLWNTIQQSVQPAKKRIMPVWWWIPVGSVAVIALLVLFLRPVQQIEPIAVSKTVIKQNIFGQKTLSASNSDIKSRTITKTKPQKTHSIKTPTSTICNLSIANNPKNILTQANADTIINQTLATAQTETKDSLIPDIRLMKPDTLTHQLNIATLTEKTGNKPVKNKSVQPKHKNQWVLAAAFGSGSNSSTGLENIPSATLSNDIVKTGAEYSNIMTPQNFTDVHYSLPLSLGLKIRNKFTEMLSIETGFIYTYLQTDFSNSGFTTTDARLELHYLGVPLSFNIRLWNNSKWDIYISGGGTIEKGLRSIYQQTQNNTFQTWVTTAQTNIDGFQFSANSAVGLGYNISPQISLFFEPQFSYYFENNQPISIRSKQPSVFSLQVGLRYDLNTQKK